MVPHPYSNDMKQELTKQQKAAIEYERRIRMNDFKQPESLVFDVLIMPEFATELSALINEQVTLRTQVKEAIADIISKGKKVAENRPTIDRVMDLGLMDDAGEFAVEFARVLNHQSKHPANVRLYVQQLGMKAYNSTLDKLICEANPDLAEMRKTAISINHN